VAHVPAHPTSIIVDLQNNFLKPDGAEGRGSVVGRLVREARRTTLEPMVDRSRSGRPRHWAGMLRTSLGTRRDLTQAKRMHQRILVAGRWLRQVAQEFFLRRFMTR
jgi:hypothetical protein